MTVEILENPETTPHITVMCKVCHAPKQCQRVWRMDSTPTKRKGGWGVLNTWSYDCMTCKNMVVVRYWHSTPTRQMFPPNESMS